MKRLDFFLRKSTYLIGSLILFLLGSCAYYNTMFNAKNNYEEGIKVLRQNPDAERVPGNAKKYFETTIEKCWKLIEIYSDQSKWADDALLYIAKSEFHLREYPKSKLHLEQFFKKYPQSNLLPEAHLWYAKILLQEENVEGANEYFLKVTNNASDEKLRSQASFELGLYAFEKEKYKEAIQFLQKALKEKLDDEYKAQVMFYLGESYYIQDNYEEAIKRFKKVDNYSPTFDIEYKAKLHLAKAYARLNKFEESHRILKKMLTAPRFDPYVPTIKTTIAENYEKQDQLANAIELYQGVIKDRKSRPGTAKAAFNLAKIYEHVYNNIDSAVTYYGQVERLYSRFDSAEAAKEKNKFLSEYKSIRDDIKYERRLSYRLRNDSEFRDSLYTAQFQDSLQRARGTGGQQTPTSQNQQQDSTALSDSLTNAFNDSLPPPGFALGDTLTQPDTTDTTQQSPDEEDPNDPWSFRDNEPEEPEENQPEETQPEQQQQEQQKPLEKRKLPEIEFDLMQNRFQLAEFHLLKIQNYDSALTYYNKFLSTYEDSLLTPKALYSLSYIYKTPPYTDSAKVDSLHQLILQNYPESQFAQEIKKEQGRIEEEESSPQEKAKEMFMKAESLYFANNVHNAKKIYKMIAEQDTSWEICAKAQYALAWIYEYDLDMKDSARAAYQKIIDKYPSATDYVKAAERKLTPPSERPVASETLAESDSTVAPDSLTSPQTPQLPSEQTQAQGETGDILKEKILWRRQRQQ